MYSPHVLSRFRAHSLGILGILFAGILAVANPVVYTIGIAMETEPT